MISRITRQGLPAASTPPGMSLLTTLPAPITVLLPMVTPGNTVAAFRVERVACGVESAAGSDKHVVAKSHFGTVENHATHVGKEIVANMDIVTIVAEERRLDDAIAAHSPQQASEQFAAFLLHRGARGIEVVAQFLACRPFGYQFRVIVGIIQCPRFHVHFLCHNYMGVYC